MEGSQIETYLQALGQELTRRGFRDPIQILIAGGTYMVLHIHNRSSTEDIDVLFLSDSIDLTKLPLSKQEKAFRAAVTSVGRAYQLPKIWFNDDAGPFLRSYIPEPRKTHWKDFGPLQVFFPDDESMLIYKLCGYSPKQKADIYALAEKLGAKSSAQIHAIVDALVSQEAQDFSGVANTIERLFDE